MFHCNGWCFPWAVTAAGAHARLPARGRAGADLATLIRDEGVTHFNGAPTVLIDARRTRPWADAGPSSATGAGLHRRRAAVADAAAPGWPSSACDVTHLYGLTETYGPAVICDWQPEWDALDADGAGAAQGAAGRRQRDRAAGCGWSTSDGRDVPADGSTLGEIALRGNNVMLGYYHDPEATARRAAPDGWFRTGDLGVMHPDGYVELRDRAQGRDHLRRREHRLDRGRAGDRRAIPRCSSAPWSRCPTSGGARCRSRS